MRLEMTKFAIDLRLGIKCKDLIWVFEGFVEKMGKANLGSGMRHSFYRGLTGEKKEIILMF